MRQTWPRLMAVEHVKELANLHGINVAPPSRAKGLSGSKGPVSIAMPFANQTMKLGRMVSVALEQRNLVGYVPSPSAVGIHPGHLKDAFDPGEDGAVDLQLL